MSAVENKEWNAVRAKLTGLTMIGGDGVLVPLFESEVHEAMRVHRVSRVRLGQVILQPFDGCELFQMRLRGDDLRFTHIGSGEFTRR